MDDMNTQRFEAHRPLMFSIAYRMLGSVADAEDMVQRAYLRYQTAASEAISSHKAFLITVITRLCINHLQLARTQRETYIGPWLPEPLPNNFDESTAPAQRVEMYESISLAFLVLLEQLTPAERAVLILREVFDYDYDEIAEIIDKEEAACRQLLSRAKKHLSTHRPRFKPTPEQHRQILNHFIHATNSGELDGLLQLLSEDVVLRADGGGKVHGAITRPLHGRDAVARFLLASPRLASEPYQTDVIDVNGEPALVLRVGNEMRLVMSISIDQGRIHAISVIANPDKLRWLNRSLNDNEGTNA